MKRNTVVLSLFVACVSMGSCLHASEGGEKKENNEDARLKRDELLREDATRFSKKYFESGEICRSLVGEFSKENLELSERHLEINRDWNDTLKNPPLDEESFADLFFDSFHKHYLLDEEYMPKLKSLMKRLASNHCPH